MIFWCLLEPKTWYLFRDVIYEDSRWSFCVDMYFAKVIMCCLWLVYTISPVRVNVSEVPFMHERNLFFVHPQSGHVCVLDVLAFVVLFWCDGIKEVRMIVGWSPEIFHGIYCDYQAFTALLSHNNGNCIFIFVDIIFLLHFLNLALQEYWIATLV